MFKKLDIFLSYFSPLFLLLKIFKFKSKFKKRVLVIRLWTLGDSILVLPLLKSLKEEGFKIDVLCSAQNKEIFKRSGLVNKIFVWNEPEWLKYFKKYEFVIDTEQWTISSLIFGNYLGNKVIAFSNFLWYKKLLSDYHISYNPLSHTVNNFSKLLIPLLKEKPKITCLPPLFINEQEKTKVNELLKSWNKKYGNKKILGIHISVGPTGKERMWDLDNWMRLLNNLKEDFIIWIGGTKNDEKINNELIKECPFIIDLTNKLSLGEYYYLLSKTDLFITVDTGVMHLAASSCCNFGKPFIIALMGYDHPIRYSPYCKKSVVLYKGPEPLKTCNKVFMRRWEKNCKNYVNLIKVEEVLDELTSSYD